MTNDNKVAEQDIEQITFENDAQAIRVLAVGKTTAGTYVSVLVDSDGVVQIS
jgi:hypothetical protein